jgi:hypothetical protein
MPVRSRPQKPTPQRILLLLRLAPLHRRKGPTFPSEPRIRRLRSAPPPPRARRGGHHAHAEFPSPVPEPVHPFAKTCSLQIHPHRHIRIWIRKLPARLQRNLMLLPDMRRPLRRSLARLRPSSEKLRSRAHRRSPRSRQHKSPPRESLSHHPGPLRRVPHPRDVFVFVARAGKLNPLRAPRSRPLRRMRPGNPSTRLNASQTSPSHPCETTGGYPRAYRTCARPDTHAPPPASDRPSPASGPPPAPIP